MKDHSERIVAVAIVSILLLSFFGGWIYVRFFAEDYVAAHTVDPKEEIFAFVRKNEDLLFEVIDLRSVDYMSPRLTEIADTTILHDLNHEGGDGYLYAHTDFCKGISISGSCHVIVYHPKNPEQRIYKGEWFDCENGRKFQGEGYSYYLEEIGNDFYYVHYIT